ncbi:MAG: PAS domain S-box protein, partial [Deltaproteobacteria bacterium]|nr:PAS domain S-box protein [Deltaproteobacteria bacterium]
LRVKPFEDRRGQRLYYTVIFEDPEAKSAVASASEVLDSRDTSGERILDLERDLQYTKENLQATIEELETSNEELQATNEELVSANEELQSTNEELQSVNEELYTVNAEYQIKIQELVVLNNDIENLLHSTNFATVFLDERLNVRKFTLPASQVLDLRQLDVGRPIAQIAHHLRYDRLLDDVRVALINQERVEQEVQTQDGAWFLMSVGPYLKDGLPTQSGVVITFVDITAPKRASEALCRSEETSRYLFENMAQGVVYQDREGRIVSANPAAQAILGLSLDQLTGRTSASPEWSAVKGDGSPFPAEEHPSMVALATGVSQPNVVMGVAVPGTEERRWLRVSASPQFRPGEERPFQVFTTFEDVTDLRGCARVPAGGAASTRDARPRPRAGRKKGGA